MTCRRSPAILLALALVGCGGGADLVDRGDWRAMLARGDGAAAEMGLREALGRGTSRAALAPYLAEAELLQGDLAAARVWLDPAGFRPDNAARGFRMLGRLRIAEGNLPAAGAAFDRALALAPNDPELWVDVGRLRWRGGEHAQAVEAATQALGLGSENPAALLFRAQLVRDAAGHAEALPLLERGLAGSPENAELLSEYAATLGELGRAKEMLAAVRRMPAGPRANYLQAVLAARAGQWDLARGLLQRSGDVEREVPGAMLLLALVDLHNGNAESAAQGFDRLLRRQPDNARVRSLLARALASGGNHRELIARFADRANTPYLATLVGRAHEALGERDRAAPYLDRAWADEAVKLVPLPAAIALDAARTRPATGGRNVVATVRGLIASGRHAQARAGAGAFLAAHPGSSDAMALAGDAAFAAGDAQGALRHYQPAAAIRRPWSLTKRIALALERIGEKESSSRLVRQHLSGEPANAEARHWLNRASAR